ncbi:MAG: hypothetical protein CVT72_05800 [Alphaproteobacteria bacterium HGW-Alphaproteobacteria-11]|nr:MAG: hypothetical protein CVT72_05800 [Alphaproteobacteria bacterium HGW-Alphaproteobacteria-11]
MPARNVCAAIMRFNRRSILAKGQKKSNREAKKPKADKNIKKKGGPVPAASPVAAVGKGGKKK